MSYRRELHFDVLKVDRVFISDLSRDGGDAILGAIVEMAHALDTELTAEGVDTAAQLAAVRSIGCDSAQGFLLARPTVAAQVRGLVETAASA